MRKRKSRKMRRLELIGDIPDGLIDIFEIIADIAD